MTELPARAGFSIVLIGAFNPRIFQPSWFVRHGLLPEREEEVADIELLNNDVCVFETDWFRLEVFSDRLSLATQATPAPEMMRDLLAGTFAVLKHTLITRIGLNSHHHYQLGSAESWHTFGHLLAPKADLWEPILNDPGTRTVRMQGERYDTKYEGQIVVKVEPSHQVESGIFIETNDEYRNPEAKDAEWIADVLSDDWDRSMLKSSQVREHLVSIASRGM